MKAVRILTVFFSIFAFSFVTSAWAGTVNLPKSGQTKCCDASGTEFACPNPCHDGGWKAGVSWPNPRFTDNGDGTVTDNLTGLVWLKSANCINMQYPEFDTDGITGMEGALPSVVGGLVESPVIAVPTSIGYGASFGGITALLAMLNSCSSNVAVVNIDNGFGAGYLASVINRK